MKKIGPIIVSLIIMIMSVGCQADTEGTTESSKAERAGACDCGGEHGNANGFALGMQ